MIQEDLSEEIKKILELLRQNLFLDAKDQIELLLNKYPNNFFLENIYGNIFLNLKDYDNAIFRFKKSIKINENFSTGYYNLAICYLKKDIKTEVEKNLIQAIKKNQEYLEAYFELARFYRSEKRFNDAIINYEFAININPLRSELYVGKGLVYLELNDFTKAERYFKEAIIVNKQDFYAFFNLGVLYFNNNNLQEALNYIKQSISLNNNNFEGYNYIGKIFGSLNNYKVAKLNFEKALLINPNFYVGIKNLVDLTYNFEDYEECNSIIHKYINQTSDPELLSFLYTARGQISFSLLEFEKGVKDFDKAISIRPNEFSLKSYLFFSQYLENFSKKKYFELADLLELNIKKIKNINKKILSTELRNNSEKKIRIGFISSDFRNHAISFQIKNVIKELGNSNEVDIYIYNDSIIQDEITIEIKKSISNWVDIFNFDDSKVFDIIIKNQLDILFDLSGHSAKARYAVLQSRLAPIQISWCGFLQSFGLSGIDYLIADPHVINEKEEINYREKIIRMPNCWSTLDTSLININVNEIAAKKNNYVTFGCFANPLKINKNVLTLWTGILKDTDNTKLLLKYKSYRNQSIRNKILDFFLKNNIDENRIIIEESISRYETLKSYNRTDIILDTFPCAGMTTNFEAAWMCNPILTKIGNSFLSKACQSINTNLSMNDWIALDNNDYVKKAIHFSKDIGNLEKIKNNLIIKNQQNIIFNSKLFAKDFVLLLKKLYLESNKKN